MSETAAVGDGPDFSEGIELAAIADGTMLAGHIGGEGALLIRRGEAVFAVGATCTHYGAPLADGLLLDETLRCPWHHACFDLRTGGVLRSPAPDPLPCWRVEVVGGVAFARERLDRPARPLLSDVPSSVVIVGGGAAGFAAAETLRQEGYAGAITMLSADCSPPCDRPNLSKNFLAGAAPEAWTLLKPAAHYEANGIDLRLNTRVIGLDTENRLVETADGSRHDYGALLLATGAEPNRLSLPGADLPHVHYLRTLADSRALAAAAETARRAVIIGASFIGLEVASSLRARKVKVDVVGREQVPMERIWGAQAGAFLRTLHEEHGVVFHLGSTPKAIDGQGVTLDDGQRVEADLVVIGVGVRPTTELAERAGLAVDRGVLVDEYLRTSAPGVFAAGDIARWPDPLTGERIRVEHFVVAERQGQTAARNMLGKREPFRAVPFFWTEQYDLAIAYVGHAEGWDEAVVDGDIAERNCSITYLRQGQKLAAAFIGRDLEGLRAEVEFERAIRGSGARARCAPPPRRGVD